MLEAGARQTAKISSLEAARTLFLVITGLAVRQALLFLLSPEFQVDGSFLWVVGAGVTFGFLFTAFRFSHGVAVVYELEKAAARDSTAPSSRKVEFIFFLFSLEAVCLFLMSESLQKPYQFAKWSCFLLLSDLLYISVSKTVKDATPLHVLNPSYWFKRWPSTTPGTAPRTHLQWAISDVLLGALLLATMLHRPLITAKLTTGDHAADWALTISAMLVAAGLSDYLMNYEFYFGRIRSYKKRSCVFVCSRLKSNASGSEVRRQEEANNIRKAQWYCRTIFLADREIPFASHAFYPYFLNDSIPLERKLGRKSALEFLGHCDAIVLYTPGASKDPKCLSQGMFEEVEYAKRHGLRIEYRAEEQPPEDFVPAWSPLGYSSNSESTSELDLEQSWKKVFVCSPLRAGSQGAPTDREVIARNIRTAQWLCHKLLKEECGDGMLAVFAPHAFYPYFTNYDEISGPTWLESAIDVLKICDSIYVFTKDGLEDKDSITAGMQQCIEHANALGLEIKFRRIQQPPEDWAPAEWRPALGSLSHGAGSL